MDRKEKFDYYLDIARDVATRGTCLRRNYGAVIVNNDEIISTGYSGSPRGCENCVDTGKCAREKLNVPSGQRYELCKSVHAEMNAIISAKRSEMIGATLYLYGIDTTAGDIPYPEPCMLCKKMILNAGIRDIVVYNTNFVPVALSTSAFIDAINAIGNEVNPVN